MASPASGQLSDRDSGGTGGRGGVRLATRLSALPHDALAELAAQLAAGHAAALRATEAVLAAHKPVPQWAVEGVLLSRDLVPHLLAPLESEDGAAAAVCSAWADGWKATEDSRRRLRAVPFDLPQDLLETSGWLEMLVVPGEEERLIVTKGVSTRIFDRSMRDAGAMKITEEHGLQRDVAVADEQSVFLAEGYFVSRYTLDGVELASFDGDEIFDADGQPKGVAHPVLAPGGLLFVNACSEEPEQDEILALDTESLQLRYRFGLGLLDNTYDMAVVGDELFVCDQGNDRLQVFSLAGEHRRSIVGEWKRPEVLCSVKDRLYLVEGRSIADSKGTADSERGHRIWVMSPQGETLYTFTLPVAGNSIMSLHVFDGKLLAKHRRDDDYLRTGPPGTGTRGVLALRGV